MSPRRPLSLIEAKPTLIDFQAVETQISRRLSIEVDRSRAFSLYVLESVFGLSADIANRLIVDGSNDRGIDFVFIDEELKIINIGSCKTVKNFSKSQRNFPGNEVDKIISICCDIALKNEEILESVNSELSFFLRRIWDAVQTFNYELKFHLFSNQMALTRFDRDRLVNVLALNNFSIIEHGLYELSHGIVRASRPNFSKQLTPTTGCCFEDVGLGRRGLIIKCKLIEVFKFAVNRDAGIIDQRLLAQNVRYYLSSNNEVNFEIKSTLQSGRTDEFWYLNNGITIVCDLIVGVTNGHHPLTLKNPQIVNGGQTVSVLVELGSENLLGIEGGEICVKIIQTQDSAFVERISTASNTQSRILGRDLRANDPIQIKIASALEKHDYQYLRKRGELPSNDLKNHIDAARLGQILLAYVNGDPVLSKTKSNEIFGDLYAQVFNTDIIDSSVILAAIRCYDVITHIKTRDEYAAKSIAKRGYQEPWITEGHFHVLFAIGELMRLGRFSLSDEDKSTSLIEEALQVVDRFVKDNPSVAYYRLFRSASSRSEIARMISGNAPPSDRNPVQLPLL